MAAASTPSPSADASYLRWLLERQPACLIRVRLDGVLLACNDAALGLFGVGTLGAILNTNLTDRVIAAERTKWQNFATRVWANGAASLECHLVVLDGNARPVLLQGIALNDHPDGLDSLLLNLRDQSQTHRLERSIQSAEIDRAGQEERQQAAREQVEQAIAERLQLAALVDEHQAERQRLTEVIDAQIADRQRREAKSVELEGRIEESQLALLVREREHRDRIAALEAELAASHAAHGNRASARDPAQTGQQEPVSGERNRQELAAVELRLQASAAEKARLWALVAKHEVQRRQIAADHHAAVDTLEQALTRAGEEAALGRDQARQALAELRSRLSQALAEQSRLAARVEEHERERDRLSAEHQWALAGLETSKRAALAELRSQLSQTSAEQSRLAARVEEHERERDRMSTEHRRAIADLEASKIEALAECERVLTEIQQALLVRDGFGVEIERRLIDGMDQAAREKANSERIAGLQAGLTLAVSEMQTVLAHGEPRPERFEAEDTGDRERAERTRDEAIVKLKPRAHSLEDS